jgi:hypothetical protein
MTILIHALSISNSKLVVEKMSRVSTRQGSCVGVDTRLALDIFGATVIFAYRKGMNKFSHYVRLSHDYYN